MISRDYKNKRHTTGMTLTEVLVVVSISTTLLLVVGAAVVQFYKYNQHLIIQARSVAVAEHALSFMAREMRQMQFSYDGRYPLRSYGTTSISFFLDVNEDDMPDVVSYNLEDETLVREVFYANGTPPEYSFDSPDAQRNLATGVRNIYTSTPLFLYTNVTGETVTIEEETALSDIKHLLIELDVNVAPHKIASSTKLQTSLTPRNLRSEF